MPEFDLSSIWDTFSTGAGDLYSGAKNLLGNENFGNTLKGIGALGTAYGAYANAQATEDAAKMNFAIQQRLLDNDIAQAEEEKLRRAEAEDSMIAGFDSVFKKKKDPLAAAYDIPA